MQLRITVVAAGRFFCDVACIEISEPLVEAFKPLKTTDDAFLSCALGDPLPDSFCAKKTIKLREEAATEITEALTTQLIKIMKQHDTHNGYEC